VNPHSQSDQHQPQGRHAASVAAVALLAAIVLLILPPLAKANFVYWASAGQTTIGRAKLNGTAVNNAFIKGLSNVHGVAVNSTHLYWTQGSGATSSIGRANLDGSGANANFIPNSAGLNFAAASPQAAIAVNANGVYWANTGTTTIGRANIDGSAPNSTLINVPGSTICGIAANESFVYWLNTSIGPRIGRAGADGSSPNPNAITGVTSSCGLAADNSFLYYGAGSHAIGRVPIGGGTPNNSFIPSATSAANTPCGVAVNSQNVFWGNSGATDFIGRANLSGGSSNPSLISGPTDPCLPAAAPSNKVTVKSVTRKKKKGTAIIDAKVPGPGQAGLQNTAPPKTAGSAKVKLQGLTLTAAGSFKLAVKPKGKTAKQLKKKGKAKTTVWVTFLPSGVAGVESSKKLTIHLVKQRKKKH
jgi:virginiamycin B lyase